MATREGALKFNTSKKLAQLNKVIGLFKFQLAERILQIQALQKQYSIAITEPVEKTCAVRAELAKTLNPMTDEVKNRINSEYSQTVEKLRANLAALISESAAKHAMELKHIDQKVATFQSAIDAIGPNMQSKRGAFERAFDITKQRILDRIRELRKAFKAELANHDSEAREREERFKNESQKRIKQMEEQHKTERDKLQIDLPKISNQREFFHSLKNRIKTTTTQLSQASNRLLGVRESQKTEMKRLKNEMNRFVSEITKVANEHQARDQKMMDRIKEAERPYLENLIKMRKQKEEHARKLKAVIDGLKSKNAETLLQLKMDFNQQRDKIGAGDAQFRAVMMELRAMHAREIDGLKAKLANVEFTASESQKKAVAAGKKMRKEHGIELSSLQSQLTEMRKQNEQSEVELEKGQSRNRAKLVKKFNKKANAVRAEISEKFGEFARNQTEAKTELGNLEHSKIDVCQKHSRAIESAERDLIQTTENLCGCLAKQADQTRIALENANDFQKEFTEKIQKSKHEFAQFRSGHIQGLSATRITKLHEIECAGFSKDEFHTLSVNFQQILDALGEELNRIQPPKLDDNAKYQELHAELEKLQRAKIQRQETIQSERNMIDKNWKSQMEMELDRHKRNCPPSVSGRNRDQVKQAMQHQIDDARTATQLEATNLQKFMDNEGTRHSNVMKQIILIREEVINDSNVPKSREQLTKLGTESQLQIDAANRHKTESIQKVQLANQTLARQSENNVEVAQKKQNDLIFEFQKIKLALEEQLAQIGREYNQETADLSQKFDRQLQQIKATHTQKCSELIVLKDNLQNELINTGVRNQTELTANKDHQEGLLKEYERNALDNFMKRKSDWEGLLSFLIERIEVLTTSRDSIRFKFETREGRPCDLEAIQNLQDHLRTLQIHLSNKVKDLSEYRVLLVEQEKTFNSYFGKNPSVGVLRLASEPGDGLHHRRSSTQA